MAENNPSTGRSDPSKEQLLLMLSEVIGLLERKTKQNQQLQKEKNHLQAEWEQAFLRLEQNDITIRMLSSKIEKLQKDNDNLIERNISLNSAARKRN